MTDKQKHTCRVSGCTNAVKHRHSRLCGACYAFMNYWKDRTVTDRMKRVDKIKFWADRADEMLVPAKVSTLKKKKSA